MDSGIKRIVTAVIGIPVVIVPMYFGGLWFTVFIAIVVFAGQLELYRLEAKLSRVPAIVLGLAGGLAVVFRNYSDLAVPMVLGILVLLFLDSVRRAPDNNPMGRIGGTILGLVYPALFLSFLPQIRDGLEISFGALDAFGVTLMLFVLIWICDSAAYYTGRAFGRTPLAPSISPKKTREGFAGGVVGALAGAIGAKYLLFPFLTVFDVLALGLIAGIVGQMGDLVESAMKRSASVKDSGSLLPGHGGVLDRFDSLIVATPVYYLYLITFTPYL
jgi:phosphatidate cytidylyltransferase